MRRQAEQKFQRTNKNSVSPVHQQLRKSRRCVNSPNLKRFLSERNLDKGVQDIKYNILNPQNYDNTTEKMDDMITESMIEREKQNNEYSEFNGLMTNLFIDENARIKFEHEEHQFPMTPRMKNSEHGNNKNRQPQYLSPHYQNQNGQKVNEQRQSLKYRIDRKYSDNNPHNSLENLIYKFYCETQNNHHQIKKLQEEIAMLKNEVTKSNKPVQTRFIFSQVYSEIQRVVREEWKFLKSQLQLSKHDKLEQRLKVLRTQMQQELRESEKKSQKKWLNLKEDLLQNSFTDLKHYEDMIQKQKKRIDEIENENQIFFQEIEKSIENINLKLSKSNKFINEPDKVDLHELFRKQKQKMLKQLNQQLTMKFLQNQNIFCKDIKNVMNKLEKLQETKLTKNNKQQPILLKVQSSPTQKLLNPEKNTTMEHEFSFECTSHLSKTNLVNTVASNIQIQSAENGKVIQLLMQNYHGLEEKNTIIEESISQIIWVLNGLLEKVKIILQANFQSP